MGKSMRCILRAGKEKEPVCICLSALKGGGEQNEDYYSRG